uniref:Fibronectin type-III domain-containing protein n=1 Tax=Pelusios castaneus TaxID=367368 RepID=A0A8C8SII7_9SAUR
MARPDDTIEMPALGRPFQLGMLYDCRKDALIPGITLWDLETLRNNVDVKPQPKAEFQIIASDTIEDKASALSVTASLKASFLFGLVEVSGSAEYLSDTKSSKHQARVSLRYSTTTQFEQLTMSHLGRQNVSYPDVFDQGTATHVVTAVLYGAQAFFVFDREVSSSENVQEIEGNLQVMIKKIPLISIEGEGALKMDDKEKAKAEKFSCKFYGDFALENNPVTYQDAMKTYSTLPKLLGDEGEKAIPVRVWLYPLTKLDSKAAQLVREISIALISVVQTALEQLTELDMRCNDMLKNPIASTFPEIKGKIQLFKDLCKQHKQTFQKKLARLLPSIRGGGKEEGALVDILTHKHQSPFNTQQLSEFLDKKEREIIFVNSYLSVLKELEVVSSRNKLDEIVLDSRNEFVVTFMFTSLHDKEPYLSDLKHCLQAQFMTNTQDPTSASSVGEKSKLWFEDTEGNKSARKSAKSISDFARANKSNERTRFIVASVPDENNPGASIYLYENGELVSPNYEAPSKPLSPLIDGVRHDRVQLTFKPAAFGRKEISGYRVEHRIVGQENWIAVDTSDKRETFTVMGLHPNTMYQFRYAAVSKPGLSMSSDMSDTVKMLPTSPPRKPEIATVESSAITLTWQGPSVIGYGISIREYKVEYKEEAGDTSREGNNKWLEQRTAKREEFCIIDGLRPQTLYRFRVSAVCVDGAVSHPSEEVSVSSAGEELRTPAQDFFKKSALLEKGQPSVYALPIEKVVFASNATYLKYKLGKENLQIPNRVIMVMGATGSGKTTLINGMINYILGVQWKDEFRFKLIHEITHRSQAESQTSEVSAYEVNYKGGFQVPYSLTIIDTPGFGDTRGIEHDKEITRQIREFFSTQGAVDHIDAVCVIVQASLARLTHAQKYVFDSVLSIFGKDIKDNIQILITFADGQTPPVIEAIKTADVPCAKDAKGNPIHFKFNNSTLFACNAAADEGSFNFDEMFWKMGAMSMKTFFESLGKLETRSLTLTQEVLRERKELETAVEGLQPQIKAGLTKLEELRKTQQALDQHKDDMEANKDFEYEVEKTVPVQKDISGTGHYITNCQNCHYTCHYPCGIPNDDGKRGCAAINQSTGYCTVCPGKCFWNVHFNQKYKFEYKVVKEKQTYEQLKEKYEKASGEVLTAKNVVEKLSQEYSMVEEILMELIEKSSRSLQRLQAIALKPNPLSTPEYIDLLIMSEQQELKPGYQERIKSLTEVREVAEIIRKITNKERLLPGEKDLYKKHEEKQSSFKKFVKEKMDMFVGWFKK